MSNVLNSDTIDAEVVIDSTRQVVAHIVPKKKTIMTVWRTLFITLINFAYFSGGYFCLKHFQNSAYGTNLLYNTFA